VYFFAGSSGTCSVVETCIRGYKSDQLDRSSLSSSIVLRFFSADKKYTSPRGQLGFYL
jgi:hypothetical protein